MNDNLKQKKEKAEAMEYDELLKAISKAVYKKDIVALYSIDMLLRHYKCYGTYI